MSTFRKEWFTLWRDRRLVFALCAVMVLYCASLLMSLHAYQSDYREYQAATAEARNEWLHQGVRNPHDAGHWGTFAFKAPAPLSILDRGARDYEGDWVRLETHRQNDPQHRRAKEATSLLRLGTFSPLTVLGLLFPLVLLVTTHSSICGEDEDGTLGLLRSTGASTQSIVSGKIAAALVFMLAWLLPVLAVSLLTLMSVERSYQTLVAFAVFGASIFAYSLAFITLGVCISALAVGARQSLALCFGAWAALCIVIPRLAASVSAAVTPTPSAFEFKNALDDSRGNKWNIAYRSRANFSEVYHENEQRAMRAQGINRVEELNIDPFGLAIEQTEEEGQRAYASSFRIILARFERQDSMQRFLTLFAPLIALRTVAGAIADTDLAAQLAFVNDAELYRRGLMKKLNLDLAENAMKAQRAASSSSFMRQYERDNDFWASFPPFHPSLRTLRDALVPVIPDMCLLNLWLVAVMFTTRVAARRRWGQ